MSIRNAPDASCDTCSHPGPLHASETGPASVPFLSFTQEVGGKTSAKLTGSPGIKSELILSPLISRVRSCTVQP